MKCAVDMVPSRCELDCSSCTRTELLLPHSLYAVVKSMWKLKGTMADTSELRVVARSLFLPETYTNGGLTILDSTGSSYLERKTVRESLRIKTFLWPNFTDQF